MSVCVLPDFSFVVGSIGVILPFVITIPDGEGGQMLLPNAGSAIVTWWNPQGMPRMLSSVAPGSATFQWVTNANEFRTPRTEVGRCCISTVSGSVYWGDHFTVEVRPPF